VLRAQPQRIDRLTPQQRLNTRPCIPSVRADACAVCGGTAFTPIGSGQDFEYETCSNEWVYQSCNNCGHVQIAALPADDCLSIIYPPNYYSYVITDAVHPLARRAKALLDRMKFRSILSQVDRVKTYLDVGCGDGRYLELMIANGLDRDHVFGVELDDSAVKAAGRKGLQVTLSRIEDAKHLPAGRLDLITMFHVIEHVARPDVVVRRLQELLSAGGSLVIETPNFDSFDARLGKRRYWGGYHIPRHWHIFTPASMQRMLIDAGFTITKIRYQPGHAFWLWTLHHWLKYRLKSPRLATLAHPLKSVPLLALVTAFDMIRSKLGFKTSAMLVLARKPG
jgi:2-polyprenyl-3-methyl-5-hydroxy-6-metoxy-1,4-benzoquinol methylase